MDVYESKRALLKHSTTSVETPRSSSVLAEKNNAAVVNSRRPRTRDVSSRYKSPSPTPPSPSGPRRFPSPDITRAGSTHSQLVPKRAISAERKRPSTPPSPTSPSTPVQDSSVNQLPSRKVTGGKLPESLWPSTMRSLSVSFQSDSISIPVSKKEKPAPVAVSDRTLRPSSNVAHRQPDSPLLSRKHTPERKRSPLKGKNAPDQLENSKPVDGISSRLIDQHRWPSRIGGKVSSNSLTRSVDLPERNGRSTQGAGMVSSLRRIPLSDGTLEPLQKSSSDAATLMSLDDIGRPSTDAHLADINLLSVSGLPKYLSCISTARSQHLPSTGSRPASPSGRLSSVSRGATTPTRSSRPSTPTRGVSPSPRGVSPSPRGVSPSRIRSSTAAVQSTNTSSVLSFVADIKKGKKSASYMEGSHQLRLLYNRYLQWRFANARAEAVLHIQKATTERTLYDVWNTTLSLWDSVIKKRIDLKQLNLELKLNTVLNDQMAYLDKWALLERTHIDSLTGCLEDLEASTLRLPVTGGAKTDIDSLKVAVCSALDVMQAMGSSICSLLSKVERMNNLVTELAMLAAQEQTMLAECESLLASTAALQFEEHSLLTHLIQIKQVLERGDQLILPTRTCPCP